MKEKLAKFLEVELHYVEAGLRGEDDLVRRNDIVWYGIQRGLGASTFAQACGLRYEDAELLFEGFKARLEAMEHGM